MPYTREQMREYQRKWRRDRWLAWLKENGPCAKCGSWDDLQVDHIDPATKVSHRIWSLRAEKREAELAKCQVLCEPCHKEKTSAEREPAEHGTNARYTSKKWKCRCGPCKAAHAEVNRKYAQGE